MCNGRDAGFHVGDGLGRDDALVASTSHLKVAMSLPMLFAEHDSRHSSRDSEPTNSVQFVGGFCAPKQPSMHISRSRSLTSIMTGSIVESASTGVSMFSRNGLGVINGVGPDLGIGNGAGVGTPTIRLADGTVVKVLNDRVVFGGAWAGTLNGFWVGESD